MALRVRAGYAQGAGGLVSRRRWTIGGWHGCPGRKGLGCLPADCNVIDVRGDKSYVYDLAVQRGIVSSRVALLLRSAEVKPLLSDLFFYFDYSHRPGKGGEWREGSN